METKHTKVEFIYKPIDTIGLKYAVGIKIGTSIQYPIANVYSSTNNLPKGAEEALANTLLIVEAGNVINECGLSPRQLLEQRNELLETLQLAKSLIIGGQLEDWQKINEAIKKATEQ